MFRLPKFKNQDKVNSFLLTFKKNPFPAPPASADFRDNPAKFIIGRNHELKEIYKTISQSLKHPESKLMFITGKQGIGKSTVVSSIPNYLASKNLRNKVVIVYFNTSSDKKDYKLINFYKQTINQLEGKDFFENLVYATLSKLITLAKEQGGQLLEDLSQLSLTPEFRKKSGEDSQFLRSLIVGKIPILKEQFKSYIRRNYRILIKHIPVDDFNFLFTMIDSVVEDDPIPAVNALKGISEYNGYYINTDNLALNAFNNFKKLARWVYEETTFLVIFDHLEGGLGDPEKAFHGLFSLLLSLRQQYYTCILISGTMDGFNRFYNVLEDDMKNQLDRWLSFYETLLPLGINSVVDIVKRHLDNFWANSNFRPPHNYALYPFGRESVAYLYDSTHEDIRKTLVELFNQIEEFRENDTVKPIISFFEALSRFRPEKNISLQSREIQYFQNKLLDPKIQDKVRSTNAENAIFNLVNIARKEIKEITEVKHEPPIGKKNLKPDVYLELFGGLSFLNLKRIGVEVKVFRVSEQVSSKEVRKTHSLVESNDLDLVMWISTVPLSGVKHEISDQMKNRIGRTTPISKEEQAYLGFSIYFKEIFNRDPDPQEAIFLLDKLGIPLKRIISQFQVGKTILPPITGKPIKKLKPKRKPMQKPLIPPHPPPTPPTIFTKAQEINQNLSIILTDLSGEDRKYVRKTTIINQLRKKMKLRELSKDELEHLDSLIVKIARKKGLRPRPQTIYFS